MAGKESRSKGSGRGLKGRTGFSGDDGRGVGRDDQGEDANTDIGVGAVESFGLFGGRISRSSPQEV